MAFLAVLLGLSPAAAQTPAISYAVMPLRSELPNTERIGPKKTGVFCGPAGSVTWSEAAPDPSIVARAVAETLSAAGVPAKVYDEVNASETGKLARLTMTVTAARVEACVPSRGMFRLAGGRRKLKADGLLTIRWRIAESSGSDAWEKETTQVLVSSDPANDLTSLVRATIVMNAQAIAEDLLRGGAISS